MIRIYFIKKYYMHYYTIKVRKFSLLRILYIIQLFSGNGRIFFVNEPFVAVRAKIESCFYLDLFDIASECILIVLS